MNDDRLYLIHMKECIQRIEKYSAGGKQQFMEQELIQDAIIRNLQVLTESSQRISSERKSIHTEVDWIALSGFRNILVHGYLGVDVEKVWNIIINDLPPLKYSIHIMLEEDN